MDLGLEGRRALVLAASKGLGRAAAHALAAEGAQIVVSSSDPGRCAATAAAIAADTGARAVGIAADMFAADGFERLADDAEAALGPIDILVVNHVGPDLGQAVDIDPDVLERQFRMMVLNPIRLVRRLLPGMRQRKWGRILFVSGGSIVQPLPNKVMDNTLRPAVVGFAKALSNEVAGDGVCVNIVLPGTFLSDRVRASTASNAALWGISVEQAMEKRIAGIPARRFGDMAEFGATVAFLCGAPAAYVNGCIIRVDGGQVVSIL